MYKRQELGFNTGFGLRYDLDLIVIRLDWGVRVQMCIRDREQTVYDIRVLVFNDIHAVPIVRKSFLLEDDPHRSDSIGHDLLRVVPAAFSGNYINIGFEYFRYENGQPHMINLVWDDTRPATESV